MLSGGSKRGQVSHSHPALKFGWPPLAPHSFVCIDATGYAFFLTTSLLTQAIEMLSSVCQVFSHCAVSTTQKAVNRFLF